MLSSCELGADYDDQPAADFCAPRAGALLTFPTFRGVDEHEHGHRGAATLSSLEWCADYDDQLAADICAPQVGALLTFRLPRRDDAGGHRRAATLPPFELRAACEDQPAAGHRTPWAGASLISSTCRRNDTGGDWRAATLSSSDLGAAYNQPTAGMRAPRAGALSTFRDHGESRRRPRRIVRVSRDREPAPGKSERAGSGRRCVRRHLRHASLAPGRRGRRDPHPAGSGLG